MVRNYGPYLFIEKLLKLINLILYALNYFNLCLRQKLQTETRQETFVRKNCVYLLPAEAQYQQAE